MDLPEGSTAAAQAVVETALSAPSRAVKQEWARLIKQVYEGDLPLPADRSPAVPHCGGTIRILAVIEPACADTADGQPAVIEMILTHLGLWPSRAHSPPAGDPLPLSLQQVVAA